MPPANTRVGLKGNAEDAEPVIGFKNDRDGDVSMDPYIVAAQQNICAIVEALVAFEKCNVRFGLIAYRDHPPQASSYVTKKYDFTSSTSTMRRNVDALTAGEGGDYPESVCCGLHETLHMDWRKESTKVAILIADAPPHGLGNAGDGFPKGCPDGHDPLVTARKMAEGGICLYTVGCEPGISKRLYTVDFMVGIADITGGQAVTLSSSRQLVDIILGGTQEEIGLEHLMGSFEREHKEAVAEVGTARVARGELAIIEDEEDEGYDDYQDEIVATVHMRMTKKRIETKHLSHDGKIEALHAAKFASVAGLAEWRSAVEGLKHNNKPSRQVQESESTSYSIPTSVARVRVESISTDQVKRMHSKGKSRSRSVM